MTHVKSTRLADTGPTDKSQAFGVIRNQLAELNGSSESPLDSRVPKHCLLCNLLVNIFHKRFPPQRCLQRLCLLILSACEVQ